MSQSVEIGNSEFLIVAEHLFEKYRRPMSHRELTDIALKEQLFTDRVRTGTTPWQTMKSKLSVHIRKYGEESIFVRTAPGRFYLRRLLDPREIYDAPPLRPPRPKESVVVFRSSLLNEIGRFQGVRKTWKRALTKLLTPENLELMDRLDAESTTEWKQVLTYVLVVKDGHVLGYRRGVYNRVEEMLRGSMCVGFGGHVTGGDRNLFSVDAAGIVQSAARELIEELRLPAQERSRLAIGAGLEIVGILNDDSSDVGRRHFAVVLRYEINSEFDPPQRGEKSITQLRWVGLGEELNLASYEYWSQLCLRAYFPETVRAQPQYSVRRVRPLRPPHVLCVVGELGSGKSETTRLLCKRFGYAEVNSGKVLARLIGLPPVPKTPRATFQRRAWEFITTLGGPERLGAALANEAAVLGDRVLVDGIRQRATLVAMRDGLEQELGIIYVHAGPDVAYRLYEKREQSGISLEEFLILRSAPVEREVADLIRESDAVIYNWVGLSGYRAAVLELVRSVNSAA